MQQFDIVFRQAPDRLAKLAPVLMQMAKEPTFADALAASLRANPPWRAAMLQALQSRTDAAAQAQAQVIQSLQARGGLSVDEVGHWLNSLMAVSYTHLDVYKRQVQSSGEERLDLILAGPLPPNPAELLSGSKLISLLTVGSERYDHVIVDGPPVLGLADAPILANSVDSTLLMISSGKTKSGAAQAALKRLLAARARIVGCLLTKYDARTAGYGYGYGYQYESYYAYGNKPRLTRCV